MKLKQKLKEYLSLDYRSLALMRFGAGLIIILDLIERSRSLVAHYTDLGVLSRADTISLYGNQFLISLHMMSGLAAVQAILFIIAGIFALMLMFGFRTKLATIVSWFLLISLHSRQPLILQGGDVVFRLMLFWMMFLPTGKMWSLDRLFGRTAKAEKKTIISGATFGYIVQIIIIYVMSGVLKTGAAWQDGTAVYYALSVDQLVRPLGEHLRTMRGITHFLTYATRYYELYGSLLYFSPVGTGFFRTVAIFLYAFMQIGFNLSMHLGLFGAIAICITLGLLPSYFWDVWIVRTTNFFRKRARAGLSIYYDTNCGFCYKMVYVLKRFLLLSNETKISPADIDPHIQELMDQQNSWVVVDHHGNTYFGFRGMASVMSYSPLFFWLEYIFRLPIIRDIGEYFYQKTAEKRLLVCLPEPEQEKAPSILSRVGRYLQNDILVLLAIFIVAWNLYSDGVNPVLQNMGWIAWTTRLDQKFDMFSPTPLTQDGWYVIPATLEDGEKIDLFKDGPMLTGKVLAPVSYSKPAHIADGYPDQRWQKYLMNLAEVDNSEYRPAYARYICRTWNDTHTGDQTLISFEIKFMIETTTPEGTPQDAAVENSLGSYQCFAAVPPPNSDTDSVPPEVPSN